MKVRQRSVLPVVVQGTRGNAAVNPLLLKVHQNLAGNGITVPKDFKLRPKKADEFYRRTPRGGGRFMRARGRPGSSSSGRGK
jgi:hypothetical protein